MQGVCKFNREYNMYETIQIAYIMLLHVRCSFVLFLFIAYTHNLQLHDARAREDGQGHSVGGSHKRECGVSHLPYRESIFPIADYLSEGIICAFVFHPYICNFIFIIL